MEGPALQGPAELRPRRAEDPDLGDHGVRTAEDPPRAALRIARHQDRDEDRPASVTRTVTRAVRRPGPSAGSCEEPRAFTPGRNRIRGVRRQECSKCHHTARGNRRSQAVFACRVCGFVDHADHNASHNIAHRGWYVWVCGARSTAPELTLIA
ncbi:MULTISPECIES: zinc ribbon domain-containing protein [unclassified Streptomyces]|uniref:zinc ribbon domain-containing protein n=1 Tax=unclassified Streptomyces TaxID=2593676 RepID=UPI0036E63E53